MSLNHKRIIIAVLGLAFLGSLLFAQWMEVVRQQREAGLIAPMIAVAAESRKCVDCHAKESPGIVDHWMGSTHAAKGVACFECHKAESGDPDGFNHEGWQIATVVTPRDCGRCHEEEFDQFTQSHHSKAGNILHSLDNFLAETVEGGRSDKDDVAEATFNPHSPTPGKAVTMVNGLAAAFTGCQQCHGSKVALQATDGGMVTVDDFQVDDEAALPEEDREWLEAERQRLATESADLSDEEREELAKEGLRERRLKTAEDRIQRDDDGKPLYHRGTWPNTGIGRLNLDGSRGSCSACHSRHDFSPRRARQPENCGKCHLGPDHPQKEIYEESKHGVAFRDLKDSMNLNAVDWVLGEDYSAAPTCATCHLSGNSRNQGEISHDAGARISWTNRPPISLVTDTDENGKVIYYEADPDKRMPVVDTAMQKRDRMKNVCLNCHTADYVNGFYAQYDDFVVLYNEKFAKPGKAIMGALKKQGLLTATPFDEEIEWTWFYLWHHEGRRARHGASMMAPDYAHWHGTYEVAERFYVELIPQAREIAEHARANGKDEEAQVVEDLIQEILSRSEHSWFEKAKEIPEEKPAG